MTPLAEHTLFISVPREHSANYSQTDGISQERKGAKLKLHLGDILGEGGQNPIPLL